MTFAMYWGIALSFSKRGYTVGILVVYGFALVFALAPISPHVLPLMFALALARYIAMKRNGNWEGKGKHWWQNMEEMGARAKTTPLRMGEKYQFRGLGQGQKLMTKYGGNGGKGKNDTLKLRQGKNMSFEGKGKILIRHNRHQSEGKA